MTMTMTIIDTDRWHARYRALEALAQAEEDRGDYEGGVIAMKDAIDTAWQAVADAFKAGGFQADNSDMAEEIVAALTRYLFVSNRNDLTAHVALLIDAKSPLMRACIDWPSGEGAITTDPDAFLAREAVDPHERVYALLVLRQGNTYRDQRGRWSLTPIPERTP